MMGYVYILKSLRNERYYIGSTDNIERRLEEHNSGKSKYTSGSTPFEIVFSQQFTTLSKARSVEHKLKKLKSSLIIESIILKGRLFINEEGRVNW